MLTLTMPNGTASSRQRDKLFLRYGITALTLLLTMGAGTATAQLPSSPAAAWTAEHREALVYVEMAGRKGTGFLVRSERGGLFVLTAAHNIFGVVDPTARGINQQAVPPNTCQPVDEATLTLRIGNTGGDPVFAECIVYLGGPDLGAILIKPPGRMNASIAGMRLGRFRDTSHRSLAFIGFRSGLPLSETPEVAHLDTTAGPQGSIIFRATSAGGLSGAPYLSAEGTVVGIHSGVLTDERPRPGYAAMVPLSAAIGALANMGLPLDPAPDLPPIERRPLGNRTLPGDTTIPPIFPRSLDPSQAPNNLCVFPVSPPLARDLYQAPAASLTGRIFGARGVPDNAVLVAERGIWRYDGLILSRLNVANSERGGNAGTIQDWLIWAASSGERWSERLIIALENGIFSLVLRAGEAPEATEVPGRAAGRIRKWMRLNELNALLISADDGLYVFNGNELRKISRPGFGRVIEWSRLGSAVLIQEERAWYHITLDGGPLMPERLTGPTRRSRVFWRTPPEAEERRTPGSSHTVLHATSGLNHLLLVYDGRSVSELGDIRTDITLGAYDLSSGKTLVIGRRGLSLYDPGLRQLSPVPAEDQDQSPSFIHTWYKTDSGDLLISSDSGLFYYKLPDADRPNGSITKASGNVNGVITAWLPLSSNSLLVQSGWRNWHHAELGWGGWSTSAVEYHGVNLNSLVVATWTAIPNANGEFLIGTESGLLLYERGRERISLVPGTEGAAIWHLHQSAGPNRDTYYLSSTRGLLGYSRSVGVQGAASRVDPRAGNGIVYWLPLSATGEILLKDRSRFLYAQPDRSGSAILHTHGLRMGVEAAVRSQLRSPSEPRDVLLIADYQVFRALPVTSGAVTRLQQVNWRGSNQLEVAIQLQHPCALDAREMQLELEVRRGNELFRLPLPARAIRPSDEGALIHATINVAQSPDISFRVVLPVDDPDNRLDPSYVPLGADLAIGAAN